MTITLRESTGNTNVDTVAQGVIALFEAVFPESIIGYFVEGSFASHTAIATSDLDLTIVFAAHQLTKAMYKTATQLIDACNLLSRLELDVNLTDETVLQQGVDPLFKLGTRCMYGRDLSA